MENPWLTKNFKRIYLNGERGNNMTNNMQDEKCLFGKAIALYGRKKKPPKICLCNVHGFYGRGMGRVTYVKKVL